MIEVWVLILALPLGDGKHFRYVPDKGEVRGDVPGGVLADLNPASPTFGKPLTTHCLLRIADADLAKLPRVTQDDVKRWPAVFTAADVGMKPRIFSATAVALRDRALTAGLRDLTRAKGAQWLDSAPARAAADRAGAALATVPDAEKKARLQELVLQLAARRLSPTDAAAINAKYALSAARTP